MVEHEKAKTVKHKAARYNDKGAKYADSVLKEIGYLSQLEYDAAIPMRRAPPEELAKTRVPRKEQIENAAKDTE